MSLFRVFDVAGSALTAQSHRLNATASNLANADSVASSNGEPYRARHVMFTAAATGTEGATGVQVAGVVEDQSPLRRVYDPKHPAADASGHVSLPNVNVVEEMVNMISASRSYQTSAEMMNTAKALLTKTLNIGQ
ncbi:MAG: flagellar basal body rod protein FlgC [Burkholderiales bacterium]|nr:flagellar basal body rod protein FlgC [Burkholderiales bacterium]